MDGAAGGGGRTGREEQDASGPRQSRLALRAVAAVLLCVLAADADAVASAGRRVDVASVRQLRAALQDERVAEITLREGGPGAWNFSREAWGEGAVHLARSVAMSGHDAARPPHVDANRLTELVVVGAVSVLHQRALFWDDCLLPVMPLLCFAATGAGGTIILEGLVLGDASCTAIARSAAVDWLLKSAYWATWSAKWSTLDDRTVHVEDTGEIRGVPSGAVWRLLNTTLRCTGGDTHPLPAAGGEHAGAGPSDAQLMAATAVMLVAALALVHYTVNRNIVRVHASESAEMAAARSKGITLQGLIGTGTYGKVFRGKFRGQTVAVKVVEFPLFEPKAAAEVMRECQHALAARHPSIASCLTHFTVTVRWTHMPIRQLWQAMAPWYAGGRDGEQLVHLMHAEGPQLRAAAAEGSGSAAGQLSGSAAGAQAAPAVDAAAAADTAVDPVAPRLSAAVLAAAAPGGAAAAPRGTASTADSISTTSSSGTGSVECYMSLLVMEYCSLGNLHRAISAGRFWADHRARRANLDWVCRTALDVARGLAHLHGTCRLVHRDVSTNNILLCPDPSDPRGFRAKLSDFGLATALADRQTHSTSQLKGTVDFMPPEIFTSGEVRFAVDIYSLGVVVYWMCKGEGPFCGLAPFQVVGRKLEVHRRQRLLLPPGMPPELQAVVWDCTHCDPHERPTAEETAARLADITRKLGEVPRNDA